MALISSTWQRVVRSILTREEIWEQWPRSFSMRPPTSCLKEKMSISHLQTITYQRHIRSSGKGVILEKLAKWYKRIIYVLCSELELGDRNLRWLHALLQVSTEGKRKRDKQAVWCSPSHLQSPCYIELSLYGQFLRIEKMKFLLLVVC